MSYRATYFVQDCPTCGRQLQVRVEYLGKKVKCQHCGAAFCAQESGAQRSAHDSGDDLLARAEQLLASVDQLAEQKD